MGRPFRWEIKYATIITVSAPLSAGGQPSVPNLEKERGVGVGHECLGGKGLKESQPQIFAWWGLTMFHVKKDIK